MVSISEFAHRGPHGSFYGQAVRSMILTGKAELWTSQIRAMWTLVGVPRFELGTSRTRTM
jgi:hypothetical protein